MITIDTKAYILRMFVENLFFFILLFMINTRADKKSYLLLSLLIPITFFVELYTDIADIIPVIGGYFIFKNKRESNVILINQLLLCMLICDATSMVSSLIMVSFFSHEGIKGVDYVLIQIMIDCFIIVIILFLYKKLQIQTLINRYSSTITATLMFYLLAITLFISYTAHHYQVFDRFVFGVLLFLIIQLLFVIFIFILISVRQKERYEQELKSKELGYLKKYTDSLEQNQERFAKFRHDYKNLLLSLKEAATENQNSKLLEQIKDLEEYSFSYLSKHSEYRYLRNIKNDYLKSLLIAKFHQATSNKIICRFECVNIINEIPIPIFDCIRVLGIVLDNAIEASKISRTKSLSLMIYQDKRQIEFLLTNSCDYCTIPIDELVTQGTTTKQGHQGLGLANIEEINLKNHNMFVNYQSRQEEFITQIILMF